MSYPIPQIVYDAGSGSVTLPFTFPPINKAGTLERSTDGSLIGGSGGTATRIDSITLSGIQQSVCYRVDKFLTLHLDYVPQTDIANWEAFIDYAITGGVFDYYPDATLSSFQTFTLEETDWDPALAFKAPDPAYLGIDSFSMKMRLVAATSTPAPAPGSVVLTPPSAPPPVPSAGTEDMLDWVIMATGLGSPDRATQHLEGVNQNGDLTKYYPYLDSATGVLKVWQIKNTPGNPADVLLYDSSYFYHWITEIADRWTDANSFKRINHAAGTYPTAQGVPCFPRIFNPGTTVTITVPRPNPIINVISCTDQPATELGDFQSVTTGPTSIAYGGSLGTKDTIIVRVYRGTLGAFRVRENFYYVKHWGFVKWETQNLSSGSWVTTGFSVHNNIVSGGGVTPNFACGMSQPWWI